MPRYALIDCNNFFASCERVFRPDLADKPVAVLSNNDGCVVARSNEVKALGVPMGIPLFKVKQLVRQNDITLFSANFELYGDISQRIVSLLRQVTPLVEVYSIDESFIDLSELPIDDPHEWGVELRRRIMDEIGIPVSIGIAGTKTLAKVASTYAKTHGDGVTVVEAEEVRRALLEDLPIEEIWGVGRRLAPKLKDKGISRASQLVETSDAWLATQLNITGLRMVDELRGVARIGFGDKNDQRKTIMRSRSFGHRVRQYHQLESAVATFAAQAAAKLRQQQSVCSATITFISTGAHAEQSRRASQLVTLDEVTADTSRLITAALDGLMKIYDGEFAYQKAGVILVGIVDEKAWQLSLINGDTNRDARQRLMTDIDKLNKRYGRGTIWHASENRIAADWHSKHERRSPRYTTQLSELPRLHR